MRGRHFVTCLYPLVAIGLAPTLWGCLVSFDRQFDFDNDSFVEGADCSDSDAAVHPGAAEVCGDGIDQDCDGADLACPQDEGQLELSSPTPSVTPTPSDDTSKNEDDSPGVANGNGNGQGNAYGHGNGKGP